MLRVDNLHFGYDGKPVLKGISFEVKRGELRGLFGPNGCGKTTLFRCCLKFLKAGRGSICVDGTDISGMSVRELATRIAYVPQEHRPAFPYRVREMVLMGRTPHIGNGFGVSGRDKRIAREALEMLGIANLSERVYSELSGGQRQMVLIARAIAQETGFIFLDEPTSALDFSNQIRIWKTLRAIAANGTGIVAISHDPNHVAWFCDKVIVLDEEGVLAEGPPDQTITQDVLDRIYSGVCTVRSVDGVRMVIPREFDRDEAQL